MKKTILTGAALLLAGAASAQTYDFSAPTIDRPATAAQLQAIAPADASYSVRSVGFAQDGDIYVLNNRPLADVNKGLMKVDISGGSPTGTEVATKAAITTAGSVVTNLSANCIRSTSDGRIFLGLFQDTDSIVRVNSGGTCDLVVAADGNAPFAVSPDESTIFAGRIQAFGASEDALVSVSSTATGGSYTTVAGTTAITAVTGAADVSVGALDILPTGDVVFADRSQFSGTDQLISVTPAGVVSVFDVLTDAAFGGDAPGFSYITTDDDGRIFGFNEFAAGTAQDDSLCIRDTDGSWTVIPAATILAALAPDSTTFELKTMDVMIDGADNIILVGADDEFDGIVRFVWAPTGSAVHDWNLF